MNRYTEITRETAETKISLTLAIDGTGEGVIDTGCGFLDHMLVLFKKHGRFDLTVRCKGDVEVDYHHTAEDIGIVLGTAFSQCLGEMRGIKRYGDRLLPMDEALILCAVDISGREYLGFDAEIPAYKVGDFDTELCEEFFRAFVRRARVTLHIRKLSGTNSHHIIEGVFKSMARTLRNSVKIDADFASDIPSTKGTL